MLFVVHTAHMPGISKISPGCAALTNLYDIVVPFLWSGSFLEHKDNVWCKGKRTFTEVFISAFV